MAELWTDGACSGNPGPGGWAFVLVARAPDGTIAKRLERHGGEDATTNNRMEMTAALQGLRTLTRPSTVAVFVDSVVNATRGLYAEVMSESAGCSWARERRQPPPASSPAQRPF